MGKPEDGDDAPLDPPAHLPRVERDVYLIKEEIARGGLGRVCKAYDRRMGRMVAVKEILAADEEAERRFVREALVTGRLEHPGIVPVHEAGRWRDGDEPFYSMKLYSGRSLLELIKRAAGPAERLALIPHVLAVAEAIAYAHSQRVIHRDLKPANVIVGQFGETVVIDWGLAKDLEAPDADLVGFSAIGAEGTLVGDVVGTPAYMAPEQARGEPADERADVYALGGMLYHVLAGQAAFRIEEADGRPLAVDMTVLLRDVAERRFTPFEQAAPEAPRDLAAIVRKAMAAEPDDRYPTARELAADLRAFQTGQLVSARAYSSWTLVRRWFRRHRALVSLTAVFLALGAVVGAWALARIVRERGEAQAQRIEADRRRNEAEARRNQLVLLQARAEVASDPTAALAWLKQYPANGPGAATGPSIAAAAESVGVSEHVWRGHEGSISDIAVSPDGAWAASTGIDRTIRLWSLTGAGHRVLARKAATGQVRFLSGGSLLVAEGERLLALDGGKEREVGRLNASIVGVGVAPDERRVAAVGLDGSVRLWRLDGGAPVVLGDAPERLSYAAVFLADGTLVTRRNESELELWDLAGGGTRRVPTGEPFGPMDALPDGSLVAVGTGTGVNLWRPSGQRLPLPRQNDFVMDLDLAPDGTDVATGSSGGLIRIYDLAGGPPQVLVGHHGPVNAVAYAPGGRRLITGGEDGTVRVWSVGAAGPARSLLMADARPVTSDPAFTPDGSAVVVGTASGPQAWAVATGAKVSTAPETRGVVGVTHLADGRLLVATEDHQVTLWDGTPRRLYQARGVIRDLHAARAGTRVAFVDGHEAVIVLDAATGETLCQLPGLGLWTSALSYDARHILYADGGAVRVAALPGCQVTELYEQGRAEVLTLSWSPDGRRVASAVDTTIAVHDLALDKTTWLRQHTQTIRWVAFVGDDRLASASIDRTVRLWDVASGTSQLVGRHEEPTWLMVVAPDGGSLVTTSTDRQLRIWDLRRDTLRVLRGHTEAITGVAISPDSKHICTTSRDGTTRVWPLATGGIPRDPLSLHAWLRSRTTAELDAENRPTSP